MTNTNDLIAQLSGEAKPAKRAIHPAQLALRLLALLLVYAIGVQAIIGLRPDLITKLTDFWFEAEIVSLLFLVLTSVLASIMAMFPDAYQKPALLKLPYVVFAVIVVMVATQYVMHTHLEYPIIGIETNGIQCALCLAGLTVIPSAIMFAVLKQGASIRPLQAGAFAVFAATGIGCLTLRLAEQTDNMMHLALWHYLPTLCFAMLGAALGKWLLKW